MVYAIIYRVSTILLVVQDFATIHSMGHFHTSGIPNSWIVYLLHMKQSKHKMNDLGAIKYTNAIDMHI